MNAKPTTDNECILFGWDCEYIITSINGEMTMHVSVPSDVDRDATIIVFNHDEQECVRILGYNWTWERLDGKY